MNIDDIINRKFSLTTIWGDLRYFMLEKINEKYTVVAHDEREKVTNIDISGDKITISTENTRPWNRYSYIITKKSDNYVLWVAAQGADIDRVLYPVADV